MHNINHEIIWKICTYTVAHYLVLFYAKCLYYLGLYMQSVLIVQCFICSMAQRFTIGWCLLACSAARQAGQGNDQTLRRQYEAAGRAAGGGGGPGCLPCAPGAPAHAIPDSGPDHNPMNITSRSIVCNQNCFGADIDRISRVFNTEFEGRGIERYPLVAPRSPPITPCSPCIAPS